MAEFVQKSLEDLVEVFEQLQRCQLFTPVEVRNIVKRCRNFEYRLQKIVKRKENFIKYAQYLVHFLALINRRRHVQGYWFKQQEVDQVIARKVDTIFRRACYRFQDDVKLWLSRIEFAKKRRAVFDISKLYMRMLSVHNADPALWVLAAKFEFEEANSVENARLLLQRGLRFLPTSQKLWVELFRLEMMHIDRLLQRREIIKGSAPAEGQVASSTGADVAVTSDAVLSAKLAMLVVREALDAVQEVKLCVDFLDVAMSFGFAAAADVCDEILLMMQDFFSNQEYTWDALARHRFRTLMSIQNSGTGQHAQWLQACSESYAIYDDAVGKLNTSLMWSFYITFCSDRHTQCTSKSQRIKARQALMKTFYAAHEQRLLTESQYIQWADLLADEELSQLVDILPIAIERFPSSLRLHERRLSVLMELGDAMAVEKAFNHAVRNVAEQLTLPLWQLALEWTLKASPDKVLPLLESALTACREVACPLKLAYLNVVHSLSDGSDSEGLRALFRRLVHMKPNNLEFYVRFAQLESAQTEPDDRLLKTCWEHAVAEHGVYHPDVWLGYISYARTTNQLGIVPVLYNRAMKCLDKSVLDTFLMRFTEISGQNV